MSRKARHTYILDKSVQAVISALRFTTSPILNIGKKAFLF
jgi:hypothetical protein